jgi:hypothetical protein
MVRQGGRLLALEPSGSDAKSLHPLCSTISFQCRSDGSDTKRTTPAANLRPCIGWNIVGPGWLPNHQEKGYGVTSSKPSQTLRCEALRGTDLWHLLRYSSSLLGVWGLAPKKERGVSGGLPLNLGR